eukprot:CAMPEP_0168740202 /NCGR_PEP_ID=MMETSP0724-20121128/11854_1 /TAXON_ID=265536 /ORGANISM="Amphiprora sp., Strain CCMP467" /LENGTH=154 /DNA_ID=CAMNT_0008787623 /DNA_START=1 /DNA_END=465 /DNA_ORIENTATION=+
MATSSSSSSLWLTEIEKQHIEETSQVADSAVLKSLINPIIIDVRSAKEVEADKGGVRIATSVHVPININGQPQSIHRTTPEEFRSKLSEEGGIDLSSSTATSRSFITHCTKGNTEYTGRGNRVAALLRDLGVSQAYNGGSADEIRAALGLSSSS